MEVSGKVVLVTGGGGGIGAGIAEAFVEEGARVAITDINPDYAKAEAERIGGGAIALRHDVTSRESWDEVKQAVEAQLGPVDILCNNAGISLPFKPLEEVTPEEFARIVLSEGLGVSHVTVGQDFCFGKGRAGGVADLQAFGARFGFGVTIAPLLHVEGVEISSTAIRNALSEGRPRDAAAMLGHWHRIEGAVIHGEKRGRDLGFPTANMGVQGLHLPRLGVYAVKVDVMGGPHVGSYSGAASLGVRPMFGDNLPNLETYLFDFDGDLYGQHLSVAFVEYLRPEIAFDGLPALMAQIAQDCARARDVLSAL